MLQKIPQCIVFDLDGTLIDTMGVFADVAASLIEAHELMDFQQAREAYQASSGVPFFKQLELLFPSLGVESRERIATAFEEQKKIATAQVVISPETAQVCDQLFSMGFTLAVSSNDFQKNVEEKIEPVKRYFSVVAGYQDAMFKKGKEHFEHIALRTGHTMTDMLLVGDSLTDAQLARDAGVGFVAKTGTRTRSEFEQQFSDIIVVDNLNDILQIFNFTHERV